MFENLNRASPQRFSTGSLGRLLDNHERLVDVTEAYPLARNPQRIDLSPVQSKH